MATPRPTAKTGSGARFGVALAAIVALWAAPARAEVRVTATVDRPEVGQDESVAFKISIQTDGDAQVTPPRFVAPDFELVNEYQSQSTQMSTQLNAQGMLETETRETAEFTKILHPRKTGYLTISGISVTVDGKQYTAPGVAVNVKPPGAGTPPPKNYGGGGVGLRGAGKRVSGTPVFLRAEIDKQEAFKGEQVVVSYYLYQRTRTFNIDITKYPSLEGFLRDDLEMPIMGRRLEAERTVVDGIPYERYLLVKYAAYPLRDGKLSVDSMNVKYNYYADMGGAIDTEDDPFMKFFRQLTPRAGTSRSELLKIDVKPLPEEGRTVSFTGGVGDFNVLAAVNKYDVKANEAVTMTVKVEGRGNVAAISEPRAVWPPDVELYDSKGRAKMGKGGVGEKIFEFLLIPRVPGKLELPALEFSFFDPVKKIYVTRKTEPVSIDVRDAAPGSPAYVPPQGQPEASASRGGGPAAPGASKKAEEPFGLKPPGTSEGGLMVVGRQGWRFFYWILGALFVIFAGLVGFDLIRRAKASSVSSADARSRAYAKSWERLKLAAREATNGASWPEVSQDYERLSGLIFDAIDRKYRVGARSMPRAELKEKLVDERGLPEETWSGIVKVLEFAELVRFASSAGAISEQSARQELGRWVNAGEELVRDLESR